jgi:hypothetical protein
VEYYSDEDSEYESELKRIKASISDYLHENSRYHYRGRSVGHSWPCGIWDTKPTKAVCDKLMAHGMVPKNWLVLKRIQHDKEALRDPEGDQ